MSRALTPIPENVRELIRESNLGYLHGRTEAVYRELGGAREFHTHGSFIGDDFLSCLGGTYQAGPGKYVYAFEHPRLAYSEWDRLDSDWPVPAKGATITSTGSDWTLVTLIDLKGRWVLGSDYVVTEPTQPRVIGRVS